ncbi:hypothetical protein [Actinomadura madurae]|nr:hypothetical protein [Actinomadura madurae]
MAATPVTTPRPGELAGVPPDLLRARHHQAGQLEAGILDQL